MFQGLKALRERNWEPFAVSPGSIDVVVLTHAHLDHCGILPRLVAQGFIGRIFCTGGTSDLAKIVLADAGHIQEEDAERANRKGYTKHKPALALFTKNDAAAASFFVNRASAGLCFVYPLRLARSASSSWMCAASASTIFARSEVPPVQKIRPVKPCVTSRGRIPQ
jgi:hypothetical protein